MDTWCQRGVCGRGGRRMRCSAPRKGSRGPFCAINADDYYGRSVFRSIYNALANGKADEHAMCGYRIENTLTENGTVSRGVCSVRVGLLTGVVERTKIKPTASGAAYTEDGETWIDLLAGTPVSMNMWGFGASMMDAIEENFPPFLDANLPKNPLRCEYYLPYVVNRLIEEDRAKIRVLPLRGEMVRRDLHGGPSRCATRNRRIEAYGEVSGRAVAIGEGRVVQSGKKILRIQ